MNFLGHAAVAGWYRTEPAYVLGAMLPDFAAMCGARLADLTHAELGAGVALHHATDAAFHGAPGFTRLVRSEARELRARGVGRGGALGAAHVGVELLIDGALARDDDVVCLYRQALGCAPALAPALGWPDEVTTRFDALVRRLRADDPSTAFAETARVAHRVAAALGRRPRLALDSTERDTVADWLAAVRGEVASAVPALLDAVAARLDEPDRNGGD